MGYSNNPEFRSLSMLVHEGGCWNLGATYLVYALQMHTHREGGAHAYATVLIGRLARVATYLEYALLMHIHSTAL